MGDEQDRTIPPPPPDAILLVLCWSPDAPVFPAGFFIRKTVVLSSADEQHVVGHLAASTTLPQAILEVSLNFFTF